MKPGEAAALVLLSLLWGSAFLFIDVVVEEVPPLTVVGGRLLMSALLLGALALATRGRLAPRPMWPALLVLAAANNLLPFSLITWAQDSITSSLAATLIATMPLFVVIIASVASSERPDAPKVLGVLVGFAGAVVLIGPDLADITSSSTLGELAVIGASVCYAASTVYAREALRGDALALAAGQMVFGALLSLPIALAVDGAPDLAISAEAWLAWLALGALASGLAYIIFFTLVQRLSATHMALVSYLIPVVATLLGFAVLDERVGANLFAGLALILLGMAAVNGNLDGALERVRGRSARSGAGVGG